MVVKISQWPPVRQWPAALQWLVLVGAGGGFGWALARLHVPAAAMLGPLVVGAVLAMRGASVRVPVAAHQLAQGIAGCLIALHIEPGVLARTAELWPVIGIFVVLTFAAACVTGFVAGAVTGIDREVAIWGFLPGMAGTVIAIAHERGLDSRMVAFIQILRLMVVIAVMVVATMALAGPATLPLTGDQPVTLMSGLTAASIALVGLAVARWLPALPAGASLVPLALAAGLSVSGISVAMPDWLVAAGFLGLGLQIGLRFTPDLLRTGLRALPAVMVASLLLIALCALSGGLLALIAGVDLMSALLATVPGSIDSIAIIAITSGADVSFVMTLQTVRLFAVALIGPLIAQRLVRLVLRQPG